MESCPIGFFCVDKNTFILVIILIIVFVVYNIHSNNNRFEFQKFLLLTKKRDFNNLNKKLLNTEKLIKEYKAESLYNAQNKALENHQHQEQIYIVDKDHQRVINPLLPPERSHPYRINRIGVPINIPTRGYSSYYQQVGALHQEGKILPLFGKPTYPGSRQWLYYTSADNYASVKLPVLNNGKSCQGDYGCKELMDQDNVTVTGYNNTFTVNLYNLDKPRYLPYIY